MFKHFAAILIVAVCMSSAVQGAAVAVSADASSNTQNINPALIDFYGYQTGFPLLAPYYGALNSLYAASLQARSYIAESNPVLFRDPLYDHFIGASSLGVVVV